MVFWGVEVKPGEPYIHQPTPGRRFRITQALLGSYADVGWSILECNIGNMNPVRICALNPTNHICDLEIEYGERENVFLSVSGSSSIHLSGRIYNHSTSDNQTHTSNKLASKTQTPACLKRKRHSNEANGNKEPSLKEPTVTKADDKNDASSKEPLISEAGGKNVASPKQPIVGEDDYSDEHLPILVAYEKRIATSKTKYKTPGIGKVLSGQNNDYKIMESSVVPIQDHEITQENIVTKADGKNKGSLEEPIISEASGKNAASAEQHIVSEDGHLPIRVAHKKRVPTRKRKTRTLGIGKVSSGQNNDYAIMESSLPHTVPIQDHGITQDIVTKADGKNDASPEEPIISEASGKNAASAKQPIVGEDDESDDHLPVLVAHKRRMATRKTKYKSPGMGKVLSDHNNDHKILNSNVMHTMPTQDHEVTQNNISQLVGATGQSTRGDGFLFTGATNQHNWVSVEEFCKGDSKSTASNGSKVTVEYVGKLLDGQIVDPMAIRKFRLGAGEVIPGWDAGVSGMRVGSKRKVTIPPALGHGNRAVGMIPANSWLVYEFELKKMRRTKKASHVS